MRSVSAFTTNRSRRLMPSSYPTKAARRLIRRLKQMARSLRLSKVKRTSLASPQTRWNRLSRKIRLPPLGQTIRYVFSNNYLRLSISTRTHKIISNFMLEHYRRAMKLATTSNQKLLAPAPPGSRRRLAGKLADAAHLTLHPHAQTS